MAKTKTKSNSKSKSNSISKMSSNALAKLNKVSKKLTPDDTFLQESIKKHAVLWSLVFLVGAILLVDGPLLREGFMSPLHNSDKDQGPFAKWSRDPPKEYQAQPSCVSQNVIMGARCPMEVYFAIVVVFLLAFCVYLFARN